MPRKVMQNSARLVGEGRERGRGTQNLHWWHTEEERSLVKMAMQLCRCSLAKKSRNVPAGVMLCWKGWKWVFEVGVGRNCGW